MFSSISIDRDGLSDSARDLTYRFARLSSSMVPITRSAGSENRNSYSETNNCVGPQSSVSY